MRTIIKTIFASLLYLFSLAAHAQKQALFVTSAASSTSDLQISNRLGLLGFNVTRVVDTVSATTNADGKDLIVISSTVGSGAVGTKFTAVPVPIVNWETGIYDELGTDSNNAGGAVLTSQTQIRITDPTHALAGGLPAGLTTVLSVAGDVSALAVPFPGAKVIATGASSGNATIFAYEKGDPLHPARITNAPARRVNIFLANDTFRNATDSGVNLFDAAVSWTALSARILFVVDSILANGTANQANDREIVSRLQNQGHTVTVADDQDPNLPTLLPNKDLIFISSSVGSGNQPLNDICRTNLQTASVPIVDCEPGLYDELLLQTATTFGNAAGQTTLYLTAAGRSHPLGAGNPEGPLVVTTTTGVFSSGSDPSSYGTDAILIATNATDGNVDAGRAAIFAYEAGARLADNTTVTLGRHVGFFFNATTAAGGYNADGQALLDAAVRWALTPATTNAAVVVLNQPSNVTTNEGAPARFAVKVVGANPWSFQWYRNGAGIPGANAGKYAISAVNVADNNATFFAVISNSFSVVTSQVATLSVIVDTNPPVMVSAFGVGIPPTNIDLMFSEQVNSADAQTIAKYSLGNGAALLTATLDPDGKTVHFTSQPVTNGTTLSLAGPVRDRAFNPNTLNPGAPGSSIAIITADGSIRRHEFDDITGTALADLTNNLKFPNLPDVIDFPTLFETPPGVRDNYGVQFLGYVTAPVSGNYHFYMSSDDNGVLYLSTDDNPANKVLIAREPVWGNSREWTGNAGNPAGRTAAAPENQSKTLFPGGIALVKGQRYYIEALMKEGTGGDNLGVAWQIPGDPIPANGSPPIAAKHLSRYDVPATIPPAEPANVTILEARQATFSVTPSGSPLLSLQWYENGAAIPGANGPSYTTPLLSTNDNGKTYFAVLVNDFRSVTSRVALLTVNRDTNGPVLLSASSVHSFDAGLCFDEALDPTTASNPANYTINGGAVAVTNATLRYDGKTVQLALGAPISGAFTVQVNNVRDLTGRNIITPGSSAGGNVQGLTPTDIGTPGVDPIAGGSTFSCNAGEFELIGGGSDVWGNNDHGHFAYQQITGNFDKRVKVARLDNTDGSAKGGLMIRETLDFDSRNLHAVVMPPLTQPGASIVGRNIFETGTRSVTAGGTAGWGIAGGANGNVPALHPNSWIRLRRVGTIFKGYVSSNGVDWVQNGLSEQLYPANAYFLLEATAHNNDGRTNRVLFQNLGDTVIPGASVAITQQPQNTSIDANHTVSFSVVATASVVPNSEIGYQWQKGNGIGGFTNINAIGANGADYTAFVTLADNGAQFRVLATVPGAGATSTPATVTVTNDITPPLIVSATRGCLSLTTLSVVFNELLDSTSAQNTNNYTITGGAIHVTLATLGSDGTTVTLETDAPLLDGNFYLLTAGAVRDLAGVAAGGAKALIRLNGGHSGSTGQVVIEAENFDALTPATDGHTWVIKTGPAGTGPLSGNAYVQALPETGAAINQPVHTDPGVSPRLDYCINFPVAGVWRVWLRGNDLVGGANSCHIGLDGASLDATNWRLGNTGGATGWGGSSGPASPWNWTRDANDSTATAAAVNVPTAGYHTFNIWMREDSTSVDKILLTTDTAFTFAPLTIVGPDATPATDATPQALINIARSGGNVTISWNVPVGIGRLLQADDVIGPWSPVIGANPSGHTVPANTARKFYRVIIP
jgi:hypothetical protein